MFSNWRKFKFIIKIRVLVLSNLSQNIYKNNILILNLPGPDYSGIRISLSFLSLYVIQKDVAKLSASAAFV